MTRSLEIQGLSKQYRLGQAQHHQMLRERLVEESGELRRFINVYVNQEDVRFLSGGETALKDGDEVSIVPAIAGGL